MYQRLGQEKLTLKAISTCVLVLLTLPSLCNSQNIYRYFISGFDTTTIKDHVCTADDVINNNQPISDLQCSYICSTNQTCLGFFYHHGNNVCVTCNQQYSNTSNLASFPGMLYYRQLKVGLWNEWESWTKCSVTCGGGVRSRTRTCKQTSDLTTACLGASQENDNACHNLSCSQPAKTCADWRTRGMSESALSVEIDPDGSGSQFGTVTVSCDFDSEPGKAITVLHHNREARTLVDGYEECESYSVVLTYAVGYDTAKAIADLSVGCTQFVKWECYKAATTWPDPTTPCVSWKNRRMEVSSYLSGPNPSGKYCACGDTGTCADPTKVCNCDTTEGVWRSDEGNITKKDDLPIFQFNAGDTGASYESGYHTIGPMFCY